MHQEQSLLLITYLMNQTKVNISKISNKNMKISEGNTMKAKKIDHMSPWPKQERRNSKLTGTE